MMAACTFLLGSPEYTQLHFLKSILKSGRERVNRSLQTSDIRAVIIESYVMTITTTVQGCQEGFLEKNSLNFMHTFSELFLEWDPLSLSPFFATSV